jgi:hypothetical protein
MVKKTERPDFTAVADENPIIGHAIDGSIVKTPVSLQAA